MGFDTTIKQAMAGLVQATGKRLTYRRGTSSAVVTATPGRTVFEVSEAEELLHDINALDFLVPASELVIDGLRVRPQRGDTIVHESRKFEVLGMPGIPEYEWLDRFHTILRIHTKEVGAAT